jgi:hypothetical protein
VGRVRIIPFANMMQGAKEQLTLLDTSDPASLESFRRCFRINEDPATFAHCMCFGDPHFELYVGPRLAATIGYHHGRSIRWPAWKHDAHLLAPDELLNWMSAHGVHGPREEVESMRRRAEQSRLSSERWLAAMPECLASFRARIIDYWSGVDLHRPLLDTFQAAVPAPEVQALLLFGWFGAGAGPWSGFPAYEQIVDQLLLTYPTLLLINALTGVEPTDRQLLGAARHFAGWDFHKSKKGESRLLPPPLKERLMNAALATGNRDNIERAERAFRS